MSSKIFVGNLNFGTTDEELRELFGEIGEVVDVHIPKDRETGRPRGFAFVRFAAEEHAAQAVEQFHGREVAGRALRLDIAEDRPRPQRQRRDFGPPPDRFARNDSGGGDQGGGDFDRGGDYRRGDFDHEGGRGGRSFDKPKRPKGSRRGLRGKKRSL
ncbi:MAG: RNA-binding protein [Myxococcales bacterium]|nr:MAG: RNA-binding protein [Myxococcales bacterium]